MIARRYLLYLFTTVVLLVFGLLSIAIPALSNTVDVAFTPDVNGTVNARLTSIAGQESLNLTATAIIATAVRQAFTATAESHATFEGTIAAAFTATAIPQQTQVALLQSNLTVTAFSRATEAVKAALQATADSLLTAPAATSTAEAFATLRAGLDAAALTRTTEALANLAATATQAAQSTLLAQRQARFDSAAPLQSGNINALELLGMMRQGGPVEVSAISPDQGKFAAAYEGRVMIWEVHTGALVATLDHGAKVNAMHFNLDGTTLVTASNDGGVWLWGMDAISLKSAVRGHTEPIFQIAFSPDGKMFATAGADRTVIWDAQAGSVLTIIPSGWAWTVTFSPDQRFVVTTGGDGGIRFWGVSAP